MKRRALAFFGFLLFPVWALGQPPRVIPLPELEEPSGVRAEHGRVYIQDKNDIAVFSFDTGRFMRRIGRRGQGPGEYAMLGGFTVLEDRLAVVDIAKMLFFSLEGEYLGQLDVRRRSYYYPYLPVGKHFVGVPLEVRDDGTIARQAGVIYDPSGTPVRRFVEVPDVLPPPPPPPPKPGSSRSSGTEDVLMVRDYFDYVVSGDRIFVADSTKGLSVSVFDESGAPLYEIRPPSERVKVSGEYRDFARKSRPEQYWTNHKPVFPEYFPAMAAFKIDGGRIYIITPAKSGGRHEVIVTDLGGKVLDRGFRCPVPIDFWVPQSFARTFDIEAGRFVWVAYNDATEIYELHID